MVQQYDLRGKTALVTGATSGIGIEVAAELAKRGAEVILGVRNVEAGKKIAAGIAERYPGAQVEVGPSLDLKSQASVRAFADAINKRKGTLDILVNNAGLGYNKREFTEEGVGILAQVREPQKRVLWRFFFPPPRGPGQKRRRRRKATTTHPLTGRAPRNKRSSSCTTQNERHQSPI